MKCTDIVIRSVRNDGSKFRPSDWVDRITSTLSSYTETSISLTARACVISGEKCFVVNSLLAEQNPSAYDFVLEFAKSNNLNIKKSASHVGIHSIWEEFEEFNACEPRNSHDIQSLMN